jgi:hypothetical protein
MKYPTILAVALSTSFLAACGGGGDSAPADASVASVEPLTKYEGVWQDTCTGNQRETYTLVASNSGTTLSNTYRNEFFENAGCTGAVVATGTYSAPMVTMQYIETVPSASIKRLAGTTVTSSIDRVTASSTAGYYLTYIGSGVTSSSVNAGATTARIVYTNGSTDITHDAIPTSSVQAAVLLETGSFSTLVPIGSSTSTFQEEDRFTPATVPAVVTAPTGYNYAIHDGAYDCTKSGTGTKISFTAKFSATAVAMTVTGLGAGFKFEYKDKVGFVQGLPYYSQNIPLTSNAESAFFFNGNLTLVTTPAVDVPDLFAQRPSSVMSCRKTA